MLSRRLYSSCPGSSPMRRSPSWLATCPRGAAGPGSASRSQVAGMVVTAASAIVLIPRHGATGAAAASTIGYVAGRARVVPGSHYLDGTGSAAV